MLLDLPTEVLDNIIGMLDLRDRMSLAATSQEMEALVMQPRHLDKVYLQLNKKYMLPDPIDTTRYEYRMIPMWVITRKRRLYYNFSLTIYKYMPLQRVVGFLALMVEQGTPPRRLYVEDHENLNILRLYRMFRPVFEYIEELHVVQSGEVNHWSIMTEVQLPKLRTLVWCERYGIRSMQLRMPRVKLVAPLLEKAIFPGFTDEADVNVPHLYLSEHPHLRKLTLSPDNWMLRQLSGQRYPSLTSLKLYWNILIITATECTQLAECMPALDTAELSSAWLPSAGALVCGLLEKRPPLRTLSLRKVPLPMSMFADKELWVNLRHLHVHNSIVQAWTACVPLQLPALKTLCISGLRTIFSQHTLRFYLPNVREMAIDYDGEVMHVSSAPRLEKLLLRFRLGNTLGFMLEPMANLRELIVQIGDRCRLLDILGTNAVNLKHLTIECLDTRILDRLVYRLDHVAPDLETLTLIGGEHLVVLRKETLVTLLRLPRLRELHMSDLRLSGRLAVQVRLPDTLELLTLRAVCIEGATFANQEFRTFDNNVGGSMMYTYNEHLARYPVDILQRKCPFYR